MAVKEPDDERAPGGVESGSGSESPRAGAEERKPLFRDEVPGAPYSAPAPASSPSAPAGQSPGDQGQDLPTERQVPAGGLPADATTVQGSSAASATTVRRPGIGEDSTQILPRTRRGSIATSDFDRADDDLDDGVVERGPGRRRLRLALLIAGVAAVVVGGLAIGFSVLNVPERPRPNSTSAASVPPVGSSAPSQSATQDPAVLLTDATMLSAAQAKSVAPDRSWKVASTQRGFDETSPQPACLGPDTVLDRPEPQQTILRLLSSSGKAAPGILHQADAYPEPEEATRAYGAAVKALGGCAMAGSYLQSGAGVSGLGDQASAVVVNVAAEGSTEMRSVMVNRTGRIVNVLDVAQPGKAAALARVAAALGAVTNTQCREAAGRCSSGVTVKDGPPPSGGDQPGFLAAGDIPPVGPAATGWAGTVPGLPEADFVGSGCETVLWPKVEARARAARTYLLTDGNPRFGLDNIVVTHAGEPAAQALVAKVKADLDSCASRKLTATVSSPKTVRGVGAASARVQGWTATVSQKTTAGTARYRVGIVSARNKTVFAFLNPQQSLDLSDAQWDLVTVRAGQRASQTK